MGLRPSLFKQALNFCSVAPTATHINIYYDNSYSILPNGNVKKERNKKSASENKPKAAAEQEICISSLDICVGLITKVQRHPDADSLYVEEIDVGNVDSIMIYSELDGVNQIQQRSFKSSVTQSRP
ncbi:hypothetical protein POM88_010987 [Heracleum sosnowskyi]|uniref:tRNA-binding domain-containing protein n=1 Tax=Heracleum sosnowskyi TaxID=360622 RepID=A0AAD8IW65_9APIA|nr:hypothetical protein POM88_010987 [Heracleum sosnowskyi]